MVIISIIIIIATWQRGSWHWSRRRRMRRVGRCLFNCLKMYVMAELVMLMIIKILMGTINMINVIIMIIMILTSGKG